MVTIIEKIKDSKRMDLVLEKAARILADGNLVAFPTETVYGLGANAFDESAAKKIYEAKGRPSDNPLIVHIASLKMLDEVALEVNNSAKQIMDAFWPGPVTLIFKKTDKIPYSVTGGLDTVAVRFPQNEIATMLIKKCKFPLAAPSANLSGRPSPTKASHVAFDLSGKIPLILDGGTCRLGLESTIVDTTHKMPVILRPGTVTKEAIEEVLEQTVIDGYEEQIEVSTPKAPGTKYRHYSPKAKITIIKGSEEEVVSKINHLLIKDSVLGIKSGVLATDETIDLYNTNLAISVGRRKDPEEIAKNLFKTLRKFDRLGAEVVYSECFEQMGLGAAIMNRLTKAADYRIVQI